MDCKAALKKDNEIKDLVVAEFKEAAANTRNPKLKDEDLEAFVGVVAILCDRIIAEKNEQIKGIISKIAEDMERNGDDIDCLDGVFESVSSKYLSECDAKARNQHDADENGKDISFMKSLFYRGVDDELVGFLECIGYCKSNYGYSDGNSIATSDWGTFTFISETMFDSDDPHINWKANGMRYDCGTNKELFKALAALNKDTDKCQWFILPDGKWYMCLYKKYSGNGRKATVEEIIEHFE